MSDLRRKYESAFAQGTVIQPPDAVDLKECFYSNLTILDAKASALLYFDGILIAVASFTVQQGGVFETQQLIPLIVIITALVAAGLCLFVAQISYPFLGKVTITAGRPSTLDYNREIDALHRAVDWRTGLYRLAWALSLIAVALFLFMFIVALFDSVSGHP
jgi:hypothetical protein